MISSVKLENVKTNLFFVANLMIFSNIINYYLVGGELFNVKWLYSSFAIAFSYIIYSLVAESYVVIKDNDYRIKKSKEDVIRYMTIYTIYQAIQEGILELSFSWASRTLITVLGYVGFDYFFSDVLLNLNNAHLLGMDLVKIIIAEMIGLFIIYEEYTFIKGADLISYLFSYIIWSLFTKKLIPYSSAS